MSHRRRQQIAQMRAAARLVNAHAHLADAQAHEAAAAVMAARADLDRQRFADAVAQRDRFIPVVEAAGMRAQIRAFEYEQILATARSQYTDTERTNP